MAADEKVDGWRIVAFKGGRRVRLPEPERRATTPSGSSTSRARSPRYRHGGWCSTSVHVEIAYAEIMRGELRDPVFRGVVSTR